MIFCYVLTHTCWKKLVHKTILLTFFSTKLNTFSHFKICRIYTHMCAATYGTVLTLYEESSIQIILWNSLCNKYAKHSKAFSPPQEKYVCKNCKTYFACCDVILSISNISANNSMQWVNKIWICSTANKVQSVVNYRQSLTFDRPCLPCYYYCERW